MRPILTIVVFGSMLASARSEEKLDADQRAVLHVLHDQQSCWNKGDLKGFMAGYWNSPELSFYSGGDARKGWKETYERFQKRYQAEGKEMGKLTFSELTADRLSQKTMLVRGRWKLDLAKETPHGLFTLIVEKKLDGWRITHDHTSAATLPAPEPRKP